MSVRIHTPCPVLLDMQFLGQCPYSALQRVLKTTSWRSSPDLYPLRIVSPAVDHMVISCSELVRAVIINFFWHSDKHINKKIENIKNNSTSHPIKYVSIPFYTAQ